MVDGSQATTFSVNTENGNTTVATELGLAELRAGKTVTKIAAGESGTAGTPQAKPDNDDEGGLHGGTLAALLLATGGAVAAIIWATHKKDDLDFGGTVIVVSPTK